MIEIILLNPENGSLDSKADPAKAQAYAHDAHDSIGQKRKYSGKPYWVHTDEVAEIVQSVTEDPVTICAAHLHDVIEDVNKFPYDVDGIRMIFGMDVLTTVLELTDVFTKENYPDLNRKERKQWEAMRLGKISNRAQTIKLADLVSNTSDIVRNDPGFARTYLKEKEQILNKMLNGNRMLGDLAWSNLLWGKRQLKMG